MAIVAVAPTETVVLSYALGELKATGRVGVQLVNMDATQTFTGGIRRRKYGMSAWAINGRQDWTDAQHRVAVEAELHRGSP